MIGRRIVIADPHPIFRRGLSGLLSEAQHVVVAEADSGHAALAAVKKQSPDILITEASLPQLNGLEVCARLRKQGQCRVLFLSTIADDPMVWRALRSGADGFIPKSALPSEVITAINARDCVYLPIRLKRRPRFLRTPPEDPFERLRPRQREVLQLIAEGASTKAIARHMQCSPKNVEWHRRKLMQALNIFDIAGLTRFALAQGIA